jgi:hypothetical protein
MIEPLRLRVGPAAVVLAVLAATVAAVLPTAQPAFAMGPGAWAYALVDPAPAERVLRRLRLQHHLHLGTG